VVPGTLKKPKKLPAQNAPGKYGESTGTLLILYRKEKIVDILFAGIS
jgi:hypothetical protein